MYTCAVSMYTHICVCMYIYVYIHIYTLSYDGSVDEFKGFSSVGTPYKTSGEHSLPGGT